MNLFSWSAICNERYNEYMKIVIISEYASRELFVIEKVVQNYPETIIVQPDYSSSTPRRKKKSFKQSVNGLINRLTWKLHRKLWDRKLYPGKSFPEFPNAVFVPSEDLNGPKGIERINELEPDILITCRAPLLKPELIRIPKIAAVNVHYGLAPHYRGNDTLFWPLYYQDYERLGACLHYLTEGIDTGNIIAEVFPDLKPSDGEIAVDIKTTKLLAEALLKFLKTAERGNADISGKPQTVRGRNFNSSNRSIIYSLKYILMRAAFLSRPPERKSKILTYF